MNRITGFSSPALARPDTDSENPRLTQALEEYLAALEAGKAPDRQEFLARHADIAPALADCLRGLEFVQEAASGI